MQYHVFLLQMLLATTYLMVAYGAHPSRRLEVVAHPCGDFDEVSLKTDLRNAKILSRSDAIVGAVDPNSLRGYALPRRTNEAHGSTRDCGRTKACKYYQRLHKEEA